MKNWLIISLLLISMPAMAGVYKWVDENGKVVYSQKPPQDKDYKRMKVQKGPNSPPLYGSKSSTDTPAPAEKQAAQQNGSQGSSEGSDQQKVAEIRAKKCETARKQLEVYQVFRRIRDKDGNVQRIDEKARAEKIQQAKDAIQDFCN